MTQPNGAERAGIQEVLFDILKRHKEKTLSDTRGRSALSAFITSYAPDEFFTEDTLAQFEVFLDITLQLNARSHLVYDPEIAIRVSLMSDVALGSADALASAIAT